MFITLNYNPSKRNYNKLNKPCLFISITPTRQQYNKYNINFYLLNKSNNKHYLKKIIEIMKKSVQIKKFKTKIIYV